MALKVNCKRREDGNYDLVYGKSKNKLAALAVRAEGKFVVEGINDNQPMMLKAVKTAWGAWAVANYAGVQPAAGDVVEEGDDAPCIPVHVVVRGERDPVAQAEREFFATLATLDRRLTDEEARQLRDVTNYLTGLRMPVHMPNQETQDGAEGVHGVRVDEAGPAGVSRPDGEHEGHEAVEGDAEAEQPDSTPSSPPPFRPQVGPPRYQKPV